MECPRIRKLDPTVVNRIAAGEVVQRPCAAVKELVENSLDAGSTSISVTVKHGGLQLLQIQDNGHGIRKEDLDIVCERFTTSKLANFDDLKRISTFGFRGEALASLTHVSHVSIVTKTASSPCAFKAKYVDGKVCVVGGKPDIKACAANIGTTISVEDMFFNMPTRKQAFKNIGDEYQRVLDVLTKYSIHFGTNVAFTCKKHGQMVPDLHVTAQPTINESIRSVFGSAVANELVDLNLDFDELDSASGANIAFKISGKITSANYSGKKPQLLLFINNRLVDSQTIKKVIDLVYQDILPKHTHPFVYLSISMPAQQVDVNVHPTKREVHFLREDMLLDQLHDKLVQVLQHSNDKRLFKVQTIALSHSSDSTPWRSLTENSISKEQDRHIESVPVKSETSSPVRPDLNFARFTEESGATVADHVDDDDMIVFSSSRKHDQDSAILKSKRRLDSAASKPAYNPSKFVRIDHKDQKIDSFFRPFQGQDTTSAESVNANDAQPFAAASNVYCGMCSSGTTPNLADSCACCGGTTSLVTSSSHPPQASSNTLCELTTTSCQYESVGNMIQDIFDRKDPILEKILKEHVYVGVVDTELSLVQFGTKLLLVDHQLLLFQMFYQLCVLRFAEQDVLQLEVPVSIFETICDELTSSKTLFKFDDQQDSSAVTLARQTAALLMDKAGMLKEYFSIDIDAQGNLRGLPNLLKTSGQPVYEPSMSHLGVFLLLLATETNWKEEEPCFRDISIRVAEFYSKLPVDETSNRLAVGSLQQLESSLYPALRKYLLPSQALGVESAVMEVTSLEKLYKVFERC